MQGNTRGLLLASAVALVVVRGLRVRRRSKPVAFCPCFSLLLVAST